MIFLSRDAVCVSARSLLLAGIRPSVTLLHCIQTAEDFVKLLSRPSSPSFCFDFN